MSSWFDPSTPLPAELPSRRIWRRIARFMWGFRRGMAAGAVLALLASLAFALLPWPIRYLIDGVLLSNEADVAGLVTLAAATDGEKIRAAVILALGYLALQLVAALFASASFYWFARTALFMIHTIRGDMLVHLRRLSLGFHANTSTGDTIFRSINDARAIQEVMIFGVQAWLLPTFQVSLMVVLMAALDPWLTLAALGVAPLLVLAIRTLTGRIQAASAESRGHLARLTSLIEQTLTSMRAVQVFGRESAEVGRFDGTSRNFIRAQLRFRLTEQALSVATMALTGLGTAIVLAVAGVRFLHGAITVGAVWIFLAYMQRIYEILQQNMNLFGVLQDSVVGVGRAFQVLDTEPLIADRPTATEAGPLRRSIRFDDVSLAYDQATGPVLGPVSFEVAAGDMIALVGPTGAGKSSVLQLIPRLYDVTTGAVRFDGTDIRDLTLGSLRDQVSFVTQEPMLFAASIEDNIGYGRPDAGRDEIEAAAQAARAHGFIEQLPEGYRTQVGDRGVRLSIGQQQRIAIARAFLKDAPILLLDEPTSALDLGTESELIDSLDQLMAGRTVFIVAHRLTTIRSADRILVLEEGRITEEGSHAELLARGGAYHRLWSHQAPQPG